MFSKRLAKFIVPDTLNTHVSHLGILGVFYLAGGLGFLLMLISGRAYIGIIDVAFSIIGILLAYILVYRLHPGGEVNYYRDFLKERTETDIQLDKLIRQNRSNLAMNIVTFLLMIGSIVLILFKDNPADKAKIHDQIIGDVLIPFIVTMIILTSVKYISAWVNIKRDFDAK